MNPLEKAPIGNTAIQVTRLGLGGGVFGGLYREVPEETVAAIVEQALQAGLSYVDTAPLYGHGKSETRLGRALSSVPRGSYVLSTKVGRLLVPEDPAKATSELFEDVPPFLPVFDFSYDAAMRSFEASLVRLQLDRVDILYIHDPVGYYDDVMRGAYPALRELRRQGVVKAIGIACWDVDLSLRFGQAGEFDLFMLPGRYTLLDQSAAKELLPFCRESGASIVVAAPFYSGILATGAQRGAKFNYQDAPPDVLARVRNMEAVCEQFEVALPAAALQFPLRHPLVAAVVAGARTEAELLANMQHMERPIPEEFWSEMIARELLAD